MLERIMSKTFFYFNLFYLFIHSFFGGQWYLGDLVGALMEWNWVLRPSSLSAVFHLLAPWGVQCLFQQLPGSCSVRFSNSLRHAVSILVSS